MQNKIFKKKKIIIFSRPTANNLGDVILGDSCKYAIDSLQRFPFRMADTEIADIFTKDDSVLKDAARRADAIVFAGGGINSVKFCTACEKVLKYCGNSTEIYFNANGISKSFMSKNVKERIEKILNDSRVKQITTRGDYEAALKLIHTAKKYPCSLVLDSAIWINEAYNINKENSDIVGIGIIRPEIFKEHNMDIDVLQLFSEIVSLLEANGHKWKFFCNGSKKDYAYGRQLCACLGRGEKEFLAKRPVKSQDLVKQIAGFKGVIAARFHANIIATSLEVPSVALVWNEKMQGFSELIGCADRYISDEAVLKSPEKIVAKLEDALAAGYDRRLINAEKKKTLKTLANVLK
ncbi:MAG: polysaccharide pyruvyl transferase family protein [Clostridiales bacterium]|nr:polysaccharide pyruvyl transferase family protein [Clostridiales bacterium]